MDRYSADNKCVVMTRDEVRAFDRWAIETLGIPGVVLMENAGRSCAELVREKLKDVPAPRVCIFCGTGNNGGDGYVIARHLFNSRFRVVVVICGSHEKIRADAKTNLDVLERMNIPVETLNPAEADVPERLRAFAQDAHMLIDGLFGTGLAGRLRDDYRRLVEGINALGCPILAVDIPSGLDCDTGEPLGTAIVANWTVTFVAVKKGLTAGTAASKYAGEIFVASIGVEPDL